MSERTIIVIDLKAFFAFVECVDRGLDPFTTPLVVCEKARGPGTIVLSVTPYLKSLGVSSRCRAYDLPKRDDMIFAVPRMSLYMEKSAEIVGIFLDYVDEEDLHVYSIDEAFLNVGPYLHLYQCDGPTLARRILKDILKRTKLVATAGIGPNIFLAKVALDKEGKRSPDFVAEWTVDDVPQKLWPITPLSEIWGIGSHLEARLNAMGYHTVGELAHADKERLLKTFGILGEDLYEHANGRDAADIRQRAIPKDQSLSIGQVLMRDYDPDELPLIIREMTDDLVLRLRLEGKHATLLGLSVGYSGEGGFGHQLRLEHSSDDVDTLYDGFLHMFKTYGEARQVRRLGLSLGGLIYPCHEQIDLFADPAQCEKKRNLQATLDEIHSKYGPNSALRATALLKGSTAIERHGRIGGHRK